MDAIQKKQHGVHYTPPRLAQFLAERTVDCLAAGIAGPKVLDPACGDGMLLQAFSETWLRENGCDPSSPTAPQLYGFDVDQEALTLTSQRLAAMGLEKVTLTQADYLDSALGENRQDAPLPTLPPSEPVPFFDVVIANPPYVRTQVLGGRRSRELAARFGLTGRVDLYHAFVAGIVDVLKPGGVLGLLTSNRFLSTRAGQAMRTLLVDHFEMRALFDFGDTRLFSAAVLPAIVLATRKPAPRSECQFQRIYEVRGGCDAPTTKCENVLEGLANPGVSVVQTPQSIYRIERGKLQASHGNWSLVTPESRRWLARIESRKFCTIGDLADVRVGVKTTADSVFIREQWDGLDVEDQLLKPLITHHDAARWSIPAATRKTILYPYEEAQKKRTAIHLEQFPGAKSYLESHRKQLEGRKYVVDAGREWFEIWVAQQPGHWAEPKIVWPDISEQPRFFLDRSGAVVNGDCYWTRLKPDVSSDWLYLMLAVANSTIAVRFYDTLFHNKLYAGRRRFMTQYVNAFPMPNLETELAIEIVNRMKASLASEVIDSGFDLWIDDMVTRCFEADH